MSEIDLGEVANYKVADLKRELKSRGESTVGNKSELVERLVRSLQGVGTVPDSAIEDDILDEDDDVELNDSKENQLLGLSERPTTAAPAQPAAVSNGTKPAVTPKPRIAVNRNNTVVTSVVETAPVVAEPVPVKIAEVTTKSALTNAERLALRANRFASSASPSKPATTAVPAAGSTTADEKRNARALRFGVEGGAATATPGTNSATPDISKLQNRAARFGAVTSKVVQKVEEQTKLQKRKERFGITVPTGPASTTDIAAKKLKRAERFGL